LLSAHACFLWGGSSGIGCINENWSREEGEIQKTIRTAAKEEQMKGKTVKYRKLIVDNKEWKWDPCKNVSSCSPFYSS
jgi:hypothetical protein